MLRSAILVRRCLGTGIVDKVNLKVVRNLAKNNDHEAQYILGRMLREGGEQTGANEGLDWIERSAKGGHLNAITHLANLHLGELKDGPKAYYWLKKGATLGSLESLADLGLLLMNGMEGVKPRPQRARTLWEIGARKSSLACMFNLGCALARGDGGVKDLPLAATYLDEALTKGYTTAKVPLAMAHLEGNEKKKGLVLLKEAVAEDNPRAMTFLAVCQIYGNYEVPRDVSAGKELLAKAAAAGDSLGKRLMIRMKQ